MKKKLPPSRPSCSSGHCVYYLMNKSKQVINELKNIDSQSSSNSVGSNRSGFGAFMAEDNNFGQEGSQPEVGDSWVRLKVIESHSEFVTLESLARVQETLCHLWIGARLWPNQFLRMKLYVILQV